MNQTYIKSDQTNRTRTASNRKCLYLNSPLKLLAKVYWLSELASELAQAQTFAQAQTSR